MIDDEISAAKASSPHAVMEETGTAFDPTVQHLDLTKDEKRRTTALMMAIQAYRELIIKDAEMLREVANLARNNDGPKLRPATIDGMLDAALKFDAFIAGDIDDLKEIQDAERRDGGSQTEVETSHE